MLLVPEAPVKADEADRQLYRQRRYTRVTQLAVMAATAALSMAPWVCGPNIVSAGRAASRAWREWRR
jgi:hypothetical protein